MRTESLIEEMLKTLRTLLRRTASDTDGNSVGESVLPIATSAHTVTHHHETVSKHLSQTTLFASPVSAQQDAKEEATPPRPHAPEARPENTDEPVGIGAQLYLLDCTKLYSWAQIHWKSLPVMEAVCDAYRHNWKMWRASASPNRYLPDHFFECEQRLATLRRRAARKAALTNNAEQAITNGSDAPTQSQNEANNETTQYGQLLESILFGLSSHQLLTVYAEQLRRLIKSDRPNLSAVLRPDQVLSVVERRIQALLAPPPPPATPPSLPPPPASLPAERKPPKAAKNTQRTVSPLGCPDWPAEAEMPRTVALNSTAFFHSTGMLRFMGYRVGKASDLTQARRRIILQYVLLGHLPQVNDRHYMREWGKPKTDRRLRKLANSLASFARNARRKRTGNWRQAIDTWEADLTFLKTTYYDRRKHDWTWPHTVRPYRPK